MIIPNECLIKKAVGGAFNKSAFGDLITVTPTPIVQALATNGLTEKMLQRTAGSGAITVSNGMFHVATGATIYSYAALLSQTVPYKSRFGTRCVLTGMFGTPAALTQQIAGFSTATDRAAFGYNGTTFGIWYDHHGANGIWDIQITVGATGPGTATITLNGTAYNAPMTAGTVQHTAFEISEYLDANAPGYIVYATDDTVTIMHEVAQPATGAYTFSSTGGVTGAMSVHTVGVRATPTHIPQADWDDSAGWLDPSKLNVYTVQYEYVGGGKYEFYIEDMTGKAALVHTLQYANRNTQPSISDPNMRVGIVVASVGGTTNVSLDSACFSAFIDGVNAFTHDPHIIEGTIAAASTTPTNVIAIRNKPTKNGRDNRIKVRIHSADAMTTGTKGAFVRFIKNGTATGDVIFQDYDSDHSVIQYSTSAVPVTGDSVGRLQMGPTVNSVSSEVNILLEPGDVIYAVAYLVASPAAPIYLTLSIQEDM